MRKMLKSGKLDKAIVIQIMELTRLKCGDALNGRMMPEFIDEDLFLFRKAKV